MPYYWGNAYNNYLSFILDIQANSQDIIINNESIRNFILDITDWMDLKYGEDGDCEDETNPKSKKKLILFFLQKKLTKLKLVNG